MIDLSLKEGAFKNHPIIADFEFHAVGQGLFYSGRFRHRNGSKFSFVYDCGTDSNRKYIKTELEFFKNGFNGDKLDLLIISHFHRDHINFIPDLLRKTNGVKKVFLPYLSPEERELALLEYRARNNVATNDPNDEPDEPSVIQLITNPISFLNENNVEEIIIIHPDNEEKKDIDEEQDDSFLDDLNSLENGFELVNNLEINRAANRRDGQQNVRHYFSRGYLVLNRIWKFKFFNYKREELDLGAFKSLLQRELLLPDLEFGTIEDVLNEDPKRFKKAYEKFFGGGQKINNTSLLLYHGPILEKIIRPYSKLSFFFGKTLLTGDIDLRVEILDDLISKWEEDFLKRIVLFQIPHHGSKNNTGERTIEIFKNAKELIINYGLGNGHSHPSSDVIDLITKAVLQDKIKHNTQLKPVHHRAFIKLENRN
jgi:hypothetical protein